MRMPSYILGISLKEHKRSEEIKTLQELNSIMNGMDMCAGETKRRR